MHAVTEDVGGEDGDVKKTKKALASDAKKAGKMYSRKDDKMLV